MSKANRFNEKFPESKRILERIQVIADELRTNFETGSSDNKKFLAVDDFYKKDNSLNILREFAKRLNIKLAKNGNDFSGVYVFAEKKTNDEFNFLYTGISRTVIERINAHVNRTDYRTATWAYGIAKYEYRIDKNDEKAKIPEGERIKRITNNQKEKLKKYYISFIHEPDNFMIHIAEGYVACALESEWNSFRTH